MIRWRQSARQDPQETERLEREKITDALRDGTYGRNEIDKYFRLREQRKNEPKKLTGEDNDFMFLAETMVERMNHPATRDRIALLRRERMTDPDIRAFFAASRKRYRQGIPPRSLPPDERAIFKRGEQILQVEADREKVSARDTEQAKVDTWRSVMDRRSIRLWLRRKTIGFKDEDALLATMRGIQNESIASIRPGQLPSSIVPYLNPDMICKLRNLEMEHNNELVGSITDTAERDEIITNVGTLRFAQVAEGFPSEEDILQYLEKRVTTKPATKVVNRLRELGDLKARLGDDAKRFVGGRHPDPESLFDLSPANVPNLLSPLARKGIAPDTFAAYVEILRTNRNDIGVRSNAIPRPIFERLKPNFKQNVSSAEKRYVDTILVELENELEPSELASLKAAVQSGEFPATLLEEYWDAVGPRIQYEDGALRKMSIGLLKRFVRKEDGDGPGRLRKFLDNLPPVVRGKIGRLHRQDLVRRFDNTIGRTPETIAAQALAQGNAPRLDKLQLRELSWANPVKFTSTGGVKEAKYDFVFEKANIPATVGILYRIQSESMRKIYRGEADAVYISEDGGYFTVHKKQRGQNHRIRGRIDEFDTLEAARERAVEELISR